MKVDIQVEIEDEKFASEEWFSWLEKFNDLGRVTYVGFQKGC